MRMLQAEGCSITIADCECGSVCTDAEAIAHLKRWDEVLRDCACCGKPIRLSSMTMNHVHKTEIDEEGWGVTNKYELERHYSWGSHGPFGWVNIDVHPECLRKKTPYGCFEGERWGWVYGIPPGPLPQVALKPCAECGDVPTVEDVRQVAEKIYSFRGPCSYCGMPQRVVSFEIGHRTREGEHIRAWDFRNWEGEPTLNWNMYLSDGKYLDLSGHFSCAVRAMPSLQWWELERAFSELEMRKKIPIGKRLRRFLAKRIGREMRSMFHGDWTHFLHMIEATLLDLERPREWFPGLHGPRLVFEGDFKFGILRPKVREE